MTKYVAQMDRWRLVIDASSEEEAQRLAVEELKTRLRPEQFIVWEDPQAHYATAVQL